MTPDNAYKYWAFISYSHRDGKPAGWLHRSLETFSIPKLLVGQQGRDGEIPNRLYPIFRDKEEIPTSSDLGAIIRDALQSSRYLIVVCSRSSAQSRWVNEEIRHFKQIHGESRILSLIVDGEPNASDKPDTAAAECFPLALRHAINPQGQLIRKRVEPIAADIRPGHDTRPVGLLRLVAGLLGIDFNVLRQRDRIRKRRRRMLLGGVSLVIATGLLTSLMLAISQSRLASKKAAEVDVQAKLAAKNAAEADVQAKLAAKNAAEKDSQERRANEEHLERQKAAAERDQQATRAVKADERKVVAEKESRFQIYLTDMQEAQRAWDNDNAARVSELLARHSDPAQRGPDDYRGVEWYYWERRLKQSDPGIKGPDDCRCLAVSSDGRFLAATDRGRLILWDLEKRKKLRTIALGPGDVIFGDHGGLKGDRSVDFSPDGKCVAATWYAANAKREYYGSVGVWEVESGKELLKIAEDSIITGRAVAFSPDGEFILAGGRSEVGSGSPVAPQPGITFKCWNLKTATEVGPRPQPPNNRATPGRSASMYYDKLYVRHLGFSEAGNFLLAYGEAPQRGVLRWPLVEDATPGRDSLPLNPLFVGLPGTLDMRDPHSLSMVQATAEQLVLCRRVLPTRDSHGKDSLEKLQLSSDARINCIDFGGQWLVAAGNDRVVRLWYLSGKSIAEPLRFTGHTADIVCVRFQPRQSTIVSADDGGTIRVWNLDAKVAITMPLPKHPYVAPRQRVPDDWTSPSGKLMAAKSSETNLGIVSTDGRRKLFSLSVADDKDKRVVFSPHDRYLAVVVVPHPRLAGMQGLKPSQYTDQLKKTASNSKYPATVRLFDLATHKEISLSPAANAAFNSIPGKMVAFSPDDVLIAASLGNKMKVWNCASGKEVFTLPKTGSNLAFSPSGHLLASAVPGSFAVVSVPDWKTVVAAKEGGHLIAFDGQDQRVVSGPQLGFTSWDLATGVQRHADFGDAYDIAYSRDGTRLFVLHLQPKSITIRSAETLSKLLDLPCDVVPRSAADIEPMLDELLISLRGGRVAQATTKPARDRTNEMP